MMVALNSSVTEVSVREAKTMSGMDGGIRGPSMELIEMIAPANGAG